MVLLLSILPSSYWLRYDDLIVSEHYKDLLSILERNRKHGIIKFALAATPAIAIYQSDLAEKLLRSPQYIDKSSQYDLLKRWLGTGLLTRYASFHIQISRQVLLLALSSK